MIIQIYPVECIQMASPPVTPNKKRCVMCREDKGRTAFIKDGDLCTKCRNTETNPLCLKRGSPSIWSSISPGARPRNSHVGDGSPSRFLTTSQSSSAIINPTTPLQYSYSQLPNSHPSEEKNISVKPSTNIVTLEHKIDLILESALEMERNQIQVAAIRAEMHKFLVELSHLNNNVAAEDEEKYAGLEALTVTIEQRFLSTRREISTLQETISGLKGEIINSRNIQRGALDETWRVEIDRREQMWQARMIEERKVWNERILEERKQWQQSLEHQNTQLQRTLQEGISHLRQESQKINNENRSMMHNPNCETSKISNSHPTLFNTQGSSSTLLSRSKPIDLGTTIVELNNLSIQPSRGPSVERGGSNSNVSTISANVISSSLVGAKPKPPNIIIKRPVVKI